MSDALRHAARLTKHQKLVLRRTKEDYAPPPWVSGSTASAATMRILRDRYELVEDGFGLWRRTALGSTVAAALATEGGVVV